MLKINRKFFVIGYWLLVIGLLIYSRFINLGWGLPYPMHPDERNMANALQQLNCDKLRITNYELRISECLNPHFFAYGQFPLYLGYFGILAYKVITVKFGSLITFEEAVMSLRLISVIASILNVLVLIKIVQLISSKFQDPSSKKASITNYQLPITFSLFIFSPFFIQFSHFGTTEALLMLLYSSIIYLSLKIIQRGSIIKKELFLLSFFSGLAIATKVSSTIFLLVSSVTLLTSNRHSGDPDVTSGDSRIDSGQARMTSRLFTIIKLISLTLVVSIIFSPHNFISFPEFLGSLRYESDVALGNFKAFYTRQFDGTIPILFQLQKIFPFALGWPVLILGILGLFGLSWRRKDINLLRFSFLVYFLLNAFFYAKWTRFMTPILPLMLVFAVLFLLNLKTIKVIKIIIVIILILPGVAFLSIYQNPDVRFTASEWIYKNIPSGSYILSETANVVDLPILPTTYNLQPKNYRYISFNFYDVDQDPLLQIALQEHLMKTDYIFVPSRRLFANNIKKYPLLNNYYNQLFSGKLGFKKVADFNSYPSFSFQVLRSNFHLDFPDEQAEETWTVFDHPVIRIYKRI